MTLPPPGDQTAERGSEPLRRRMGCVGGMYLIPASLIVGLLSWVALGFLGVLARDQDVTITPIAQAVLDHRMLATLTVLPPLVIGIFALRGKRHVIVLGLIGSALLAIPFLIVVLTFLAVLAPLYTYREIG